MFEEIKKVSYRCSIYNNQLIIIAATASSAFSFP